MATKPFLSMADILAQKTDGDLSDSKLRDLDKRFSALTRVGITLAELSKKLKALGMTDEQQTKLLNPILAAVSGPAPIR